MKQRGQATYYVAAKPGSEAVAGEVMTRLDDAGCKPIAPLADAPTAKPYLANISLNRPQAKLIRQAATNCDIFVLLAGDDLMDALIELGMALGVSQPNHPKLIYVLGEEVLQSIFFTLPEVRCVDTIDELIGSVMWHRRKLAAYWQGEGQLASSIISVTAAFYGLATVQILGRRRDRVATQARQVAAFLIRQWTHFSYPEIGRLFGRDHTTILAACRRITGKLHNDHGLRLDLAAIESRLGLAHEEVIDGAIAQAEPTAT